MAGQAARDAGVLNLGLKDQRLALHWLQANVGAFGGDPKKVALWGQSVGGGSTVWQAVAYGGRNDGLFRAAIIDSFAGSILNGTIANNAAGWSRCASLNIPAAIRVPSTLPVVSAAGCGSGADELNCLRVRPACGKKTGRSKCIARQNLDYKTFYAAAGNASTATGPVVDGDLIPDLSLLENVAADRMPPIPIISGIVKDEATCAFTLFRSRCADNSLPRSRSRRANRVRQRHCTLRSSLACVTGAPTVLRRTERCRLFH
jgi:carboxylesterase type B